MQSLRYQLSWQVLLVSLLLGGVAVAAGDCCDHCGCAQPLTRVCRPVYATRAVETTVWDAVREEYCLPRHVRPVMRCAGCCDAPAPCADCQSWSKPPRTRKRLIQKQHVEQVPTILWVTEYRCEACAGQLPSEPWSEQPPAPEPPPAAKPVSTWDWFWSRAQSSPSESGTQP